MAWLVCEATVGEAKARALTAQLSLQRAAVKAGRKGLPQGWGAPALRCNSGAVVRVYTHQLASSEATHPDALSPQVAGP